MAEKIDFLNGVSRLHAFYTENVRILARAYNLSDEEASQLLDGFGYHNVARSILAPPKEPGSEPDNFSENERDMRGLGLS